MEDIESTEIGRQLRITQRKAALAASRHIESLRRLASRYLKESVGFRDRVRFILSKQDVAEKAALVGQALDVMKSATIRSVPYFKVQMRKSCPLTDYLQVRKVRRVTASRTSKPSIQKPADDAWTSERPIRENQITAWSNRKGSTSHAWSSRISSSIDNCKAIGAKGTLFAFLISILSHPRIQSRYYLTRSQLYQSYFYSSSAVPYTQQSLRPTYHATPTSPIPHDAVPQSHSPSQ